MSRERSDGFVRGCLLGGLALVLTCLPGQPARAELSELLKREFHPPSELGIRVVTDGGLGELQATLGEEGLKVLCLQVGPEALEAEGRLGALLSWVRGGGSLWLYDARLAARFGMRPEFLRAEQFRHRPEEGEFGGQVNPGVATTVMATGPHPVLAGVGQATIFLPALEDGTYGAVAAEGDTVPLLQFAARSPALAALRREGRGLIVFKPLLWTLPLSGERFQLNLLEFSAGFGVPGVAGDGRVGEPPGPQAPFVEGRPALPLAMQPSTAAPAELPETPSARLPASLEGTAETPDSPLSDRVELSRGERLEGRVVSLIPFETSSASLRLRPEELVELVVGAPLGLDRVRTRDGRDLSGFLLLEEIELVTPGGTRSLSKREIRSVRFGASP